MSYRVRQIAPESKLCHECSLDMIAQVISPQEILEVLAEQNAFEQRERRLNMLSTISTLMAMSCYPEQSMQEVLQTVMHAPEMLWPTQRQAEAVVASKTALAYRRKPLGGKPLQVLFQRIARWPARRRQERLPLAIGSWLLIAHWKRFPIPRPTRRSLAA